MVHMTTKAQQIADQLTADVRADGVIPLNEWTDHFPPEQKEVDRLATSMRHGWAGPPVLTDERCAVTGTHRIAAARAAGINIPTLELADVSADADAAIDYLYNNTGVDLASIVAYLFTRYLGEDTATELGNDLDIHGQVEILDAAMREIEDGA